MPSQNEFCKLPANWGLELHKLLKKIAKYCNDYNMLRKVLIDIELCEQCSKNSLKCCLNTNINASCGDIFHIMSTLSPHFQHLRNLQRFLYEIRSIS